jgi:hypothetical protein
MRAVENTVALKSPMCVRSAPTSHDANQEQSFSCVEKEKKLQLLHLEHRAAHSEAAQCSDATLSAHEPLSPVQ